MNTNTGHFVEEESAEAWMERISVGEIIKIKGEECEVVVIGKREVTLKLLSHEDLMKREIFSISAKEIRDLRGA